VVEAPLDPGPTALSAWTANVPFDERDTHPSHPGLTGFPLYTIRGMPADGIVVTVLQLNPIAATPEPPPDLTSRPSMRLPLQLDDAVVREPEAEEPQRPLTVYQLEGVIGGEFITVKVYVGNDHPTERDQRSAQGALARLVNTRTGSPSPIPDPAAAGQIPYPREQAYGGGIAIGAGSVWIGIASGRENADGSVLRIDPDTNGIVAEIPIAAPTFRHRMDATDDAVWVASAGGAVQRIDPATNSVVATIDVDGEPSALAARDEAVWVTAIEDRSDGGLQNIGWLVRIDPATNAVVAEIPLGAAATGYEDVILLGEGSVWVLGPRLVSRDTEAGGELVRVDPATNTVADTIPIDGFRMVMTEDQEAIWIRSPKDGLSDEGSREVWVWRVVDTTTDAVSAPFSFPSAFDAGLSAVDDGALWTVAYDQSESVVVARLDPGTLEVAASSAPMDTNFTDALADTTSETAWITTATQGIVRVDLSP
jgi:hypothetical protein